MAIGAVLTTIGAVVPAAGVDIGCGMERAVAVTTGGSARRVICAEIKRDVPAS